MTSVARRTASRARLAAALLVLFTGCTDRTDDPAGAAAGIPVGGPDPDGTRQEIDAAIEAFFAAYEAGDADSVLSFFTDDAWLMPPDAPTVRGTAELAPHLASGMALGRWIQTAPTDTLTQLGTHAVQVGRYTVRFEPTDATPPGLTTFEDRGRYMVHWIHREGRWLMSRYMANKDGA